MSIDGAKLKEYRKLKGMSQEELAKKLNPPLTKMAISAWERERNNVDDFYLKQVVNILNISDINSLLKVEFKSNILPKQSDTVQNTAELREFIKDAMMDKGLKNASDLCKIINYDSVSSIERLLKGKINFFPNMLSSIFDALDINADDAPISADERTMLLPKGLFDKLEQSCVVPVIDWANAADGISFYGGDATLMQKWDPDITETIPAPVSKRKSFVFRVSGESMEPAILDNELLFCDRKYGLDEVQNNKIVVIKFNDCAKYPDCVICKRFHQVGDTILLTSDNPKGKNFDVKASDIEFISVVTGKHVEF